MEISKYYWLFLCASGHSGFQEAGQNSVENNLGSVSWRGPQNGARQPKMWAEHTHIRPGFGQTLPAVALQKVKNAEVGDPKVPLGVLVQDPSSQRVSQEAPRAGQVYVFLSFHFRNIKKLIVDNPE